MSENCKNKEYQKGLSEAWSLAATISKMDIKEQFEIFNKTGIINIFNYLTVEEALEKFKAWEKNNCYEEIENLSAGTTIEIGSIEMEIINSTYPAVGTYKFGVLCLTKDILFEKPFDEGNNNDWRSSTLRKYLNEEFKDSLPEELKEALFPFERDLMANDGMKDYGKCTDDVSLISEREYQDYREHISDKSDWWWTLTAWSAKPRNSDYARIVNTDGSLHSHDADNDDNGVSPVFLIKPSTKVKVCK